MEFAIGFQLMENEQQHGTDTEFHLTDPSDLSALEQLSIGAIVLLSTLLQGFSFLLSA
jgi:hypothetical protein